MYLVMVDSGQRVKSLRDNIDERWVLDI